MSDLTICRFEQDHADRLTDLWRAAFPSDPLDYIEAFFAHLPHNAVTLTGESDGEIVTMLFLLPAEAWFQGRSYPVRYLYAGCTHPHHRGQGYYRVLMTAAAQTVAAAGEHAIYLHPADEKLTATYQRMGYRAGICRGSLAGNNERLPLCDSVDEYMRKRQDVIARISKNAVIWNTADAATRFFVIDAVARGAGMYGDDRCTKLAFGNTIIESITSVHSAKDDYCLWLPLGDTPLTAWMAEYDGITGLVGD